MKRAAGEVISQDDKGRRRSGPLPGLLGAGLICRTGIFLPFLAVGLMGAGPTGVMGVGLVGAGLMGVTVGLQMILRTN
jgi:hypothetical protein